MPGRRMVRDYHEARDWLESFIPQVYGKENLGLIRIQNLLLKLGNPEKKFKSIHIGGTAGKGSTAFYIARLLAFSNPKLKIGLHVSPHLNYVGERMQINGKPVSVKRLVGLVNEIKPVVDDIKRNQPQLLPSYFEILVAMTFLYFAREKVDWAIVEVGLGGRLDATNVLFPELAVITNVGLEHTEILGKTISKIAKEKAGIVKSGVPVLTAASGKALEIIKKVAKEKKAPLVNLYTQSGKINPKSDSDLYIRLYIDIFGTGRVNAARSSYMLAILGVSWLGMKLNAKIIKNAFSKGFDGRFEEIEERILLDGAHNLDKVRALIVFIDAKHFRGTSSPMPTRGRTLKISMVLAFKQGKDWKRMVNLLVKSLPIERIIATEYEAVTDTGRGSAVKAEEIGRYLKSKKLKSEVIRNSQKAVIHAINAESGHLVLVIGSLYLVGEVRTLWHLPQF